MIVIAFLLKFDTILIKLEHIQIKISSSLKVGYTNKYQSGLYFGKNVSQSHHTAFSLLNTRSVFNAHLTPSKRSTFFAYFMKWRYLLNFDYAFN